jgi:hypothetical protein
MAKRVGVIQISIEAGTANFIRDMDVAKAKIGSFGQSSKQSMIASSSALRELEGNFANNNRAIARFLANTLHMGPALSAIFPLVGGLAFGTMIVELGSKVNDFFKSIREAPAKIDSAFRAVITPMVLQGDEARLSIDRVNNEIAKLEGKRQNTVKIALDEAVVSADKLSASLGKSLDALDKLMKENKVGLFRQLFGEVSGGDSDKVFKKFKEGFDNSTLSWDDQIRAARKSGNKVQQASLEASKDEDLKKQLAAADAQTRTDLAKLQAKETKKVWMSVPGKEGEPGALGVMGGPKMALVDQPSGWDATSEKKLAYSRHAVLGAMSNDIDEEAERRGSNAKLAVAQAAEEGRKIGLPLRNALEALDAEIAGAKARLAVIGQGEAAQTTAKATAETDKKVQEINRAQPLNKLNLAQQDEIGSRKLTKAKLDTQIEWNTKLDETTKRIKDEVLAQEMLTAAIGKGYEAVKKANIESELMKSFAGKYAEKKESPEAAAQRALASSAYDAKATATATGATDRLNDQIELEALLAKVQIQGAEAVRLATLQFRLEKLAKDGVTGATQKQIQAELGLYAATRTNQAAGEMAKLNERIEAVKRLTLAQQDGAEAVRKAELENKYAAMRFAGDKPQVVDETRRADELQHEKDVTTKVYDRINVHKNLLETLDQEKQNILDSLEKGIKPTLDQERALLAIENERLKVAVDQALAGRTAKDGVRAFFLEMQQQAKSAAEIIYESLNSALDKVSDQFTKLITGQKTDFGKMFQEVGQDMLKSSIKSGLSNVLGAVGKKLGITGKPDGSSRDKALWVRDANGQRDWGSSKIGDLAPGPQDQNNGPLGLGRIAPGFFSKAIEFLGTLLGGGGGESGSTPSVSSSISYMAAGGSLSANQAYMVGENGPEILSGASGRISSNAESQRMLSGGGDTHLYNIDARGTDPVQTEQRVRAAITAAHNSAVGTSVQVSADRLRRTPAHA